MAHILGGKFSEGIVVESDSRYISSVKSKVVDIDDKTSSIFPITDHALVCINSTGLLPEATSKFGTNLKHNLNKDISSQGASLEQYAEQIRSYIMEINRHIVFQPDVMLAGYDYDENANPTGEPYFISIFDAVAGGYIARKDTDTYCSTNSFNKKRIEQAADEIEINLRLNAYSANSVVQELYEIIRVMADKDRDIGGTIACWIITKEGVRTSSELTERGPVGKPVTIGEAYPLRKT